MSKRLFTATLWASTVMIILAFFPAPAAAQEQSYYTYVSFWAVPRSDWAAFDKQEKALAPTMEKLVSDGTIIDWGDGAMRVHQEDGYTHADFFSASSRANLLKALEIIWASSTNAAFAATTKHRDVFHRTIAHGGNTASGATGYIRVTMWQARPGEASALEAFVIKEIKPMLDKDVENGTILMYNFDEEDIHTGPPGSYDLAVMFPNGEAIDKFFAEIAAEGKANPEIEKVLDSLTVEKAHRDSLSRITAYEHK